MKNLFRNFLIAEFLVILIVSVVFKLITERLIAATVAGSIFVILGAWIVGSALRYRSIRKTPTFVLGCAHLFVIALPLLIIRLMNYSSAFENIKIWGLPGPVFHQLSTAVYFVMMIATAFDWWRLRRQQLPSAGELRK
jgi:hypothetical protein